MIRLLLCIAIAATCFRPSAALEPPVAAGFPQTDVTVASDPLCGVYRIGLDGALFEIRRTEGYAVNYEMTVIDSPDYTVAPGTPCGTLTPSGRPGRFDANMVVRPGSGSNKMRSCVVEYLPDSETITFVPYRRNGRVDFTRWLPYLFRVAYQPSNRPSDLDGAVKISPRKRPEYTTF